MSDAMTRVLAQSVQALTPAKAPKAPRKRAARPSPSVNPSRPKEMPVTEDRTLDLPALSAEELAGPLGRTLPRLDPTATPGEAVEALHQETLRQARVALRPSNRNPVASRAAAAAAQQVLLAQVPRLPQAPAAPAEAAAPVEPVVSAAGGYTKTRLGTLVLVGNVGASKQILAKRVAGRDLVEFSFAARTLGHTEPTWYRCTLWEGAEETLDLIRQGTYLQLKGQAVQSQSHRTGKVFLDVTVQRLAEGPVKGQQLSVAGAHGAVPQEPQTKGYFRRLWDALRGR